MVSSKGSVQSTSSPLLPQPSALLGMETEWWALYEWLWLAIWCEWNSSVLFLSLPFQLALDQPDEPDISLASNLERQLLYSARPSLLDNAPVITNSISLCILIVLSYDVNTLDWSTRWHYNIITSMPCIPYSYDIVSVSCDIMSHACIQIELEHRGRTHTEIVSPSHDQPVETESTV